jgi:hypothetical protein
MCYFTWNYSGFIESVAFVMIFIKSALCFGGLFDFESLPVEHSLGSIGENSQMFFEALDMQFWF